MFHSSGLLLSTITCQHLFLNLFENQDVIDFKMGEKVNFHGQNGTFFYLLSGFLSGLGNVCILMNNTPRQTIAIE